MNQRKMWAVMAMAGLLAACGEGVNTSGGPQAQSTSPESGAVVNSEQSASGDVHSVLTDAVDGRELGSLDWSAETKRARAIVGARTFEYVVDPVESPAPSSAPEFFGAQLHGTWSVLQRAEQPQEGVSAMGCTAASDLSCFVYAHCTESTETTLGYYACLYNLRHLM